MTEKAAIHPPLSKLEVGVFSPKMIKNKTIIQHNDIYFRPMISAARLPYHLPSSNASVPCGILKAPACSGDQLSSSGPLL
jgi:hypothetical protein